MDTKQTMVILCGGRGERIAPLSKRYGCKSLIPICGIPAIEYVLRVVRSAQMGQVFLCVDRREIVKPFRAILKRLKIHNVKIHEDKGLGTVHALYELRAQINSPQTMVLFGHHPITLNHLRMMQRFEKKSCVIVSLYRTSSDSLRKITAVDAQDRCTYIRRGNAGSNIKRNQRYADVPYLVPHSFIRGLKDVAIRSYDAMLTWREGGNEIYGIRANFPHEFHTTADIPYVESFAQMHFEKAGSLENNSGGKA